MVRQPSREGSTQQTPTSPTSLQRRPAVTRIHAHYRSRQNVPESSGRLVSLELKIEGPWTWSQHQVIDLAAIGLELNHLETRGVSCLYKQTHINTPINTHKHIRGEKEKERKGKMKKKKKADVLRRKRPSYTKVQYQAVY